MTHSVNKNSEISNAYLHVFYVRVHTMVFISKEQRKKIMFENKIYDLTKFL